MMHGQKNIKLNHLYLTLTNYLPKSVTKVLLLHFNIFF